MPAWSRHWMAGMWPFTPSTTIAAKLPLLSTCLHAATPPSGVSMWSIFTSWIWRPWIPPALLTMSAHRTTPLSYQELMICAAAPPLNWASTLILIDVDVTPGVGSELAAAVVAVVAPVAVEAVALDAVVGGALFELLEHAPATTAMANDTPTARRVGRRRRRVAGALTWDAKNAPTGPPSPCNRTLTWHVACRASSGAPDYRELRSDRQERHSATGSGVSGRPRRSTTSRLYCTVPVTPDASCDASHTAAAPIASGASIMSSGTCIPPAMAPSVITTLFGARQLTATLCGASSTASPA